MQNKIELLKWDTDFFGFNVAKVTSFGEAAGLKELLKKENVRLAYFESPERVGGIGKEICVKNTYSIHLLNEFKPTDSRSKSFAQDEDWKKIKDLTVLAGKYSRFHRDPNIPKDKFKMLYELWAQNSVSRKFADDVFIYEVKSQRAGLVTLKFNGDTANIGLMSVAEDKQGLGIASQLLLLAKNEAKAKGCTFLKVATQKDNTAACEFYGKNGFSLESSKYVYHIWT